MNADGSGRTRLTETPEAREYAPAWSPNGARIALTRETKVYVETGDYYTTAYDVYAIDADGTGEVRLTDGSKSASPAWSPDGSRIAFSSWRSGGTQVYAMDAVPEGHPTSPSASRTRAATRPTGPRTVRK